MFMMLVQLDCCSTMCAAHQWMRESPVVTYRNISLTIVCAMYVTQCPPAVATPLFDQAAPLEVQLVGPLHTLISNDDGRDELPFVLRENGNTHEIQVRVRGKSRTRVCKIPPLRLNFRKQQTAGTVFDGQDKLKLVTHCRNQDRAEKNVLEEYAAYRIFDLLSGIGYKVRLLKVTYSDTDGELEADKGPRYAILLESKEEMAARVGGAFVQQPGVTLQSLDEDHAATVYAFQYLIGNTDWSLVRADGDDACCHNGDLLKLGTRIFLIPYDFDLAGIVDAAYAKPDPSLGMRSVKQRRYRGYCTSSEAVRRAIRNIKGQEESIIAEIRDLPGLTADARIKGPNPAERIP